MCVSLNCPNCGAVVGTASHEDYYKNKYYYKGDDGNPICKNCGAGTFENIERNIFIYALVAIVVVIVLLVCFT
jgi:ribosomal protein S27AE